jgi:hypothetical protein
MIGSSVPAHTLAAEQNVEIILLGVCLELLKGNNLGVGHVLSRRVCGEVREWYEGRERMRGGMQGQE